MTLGLKANNDGSAAVQTGGVDQIAISAAGVVTFPNTPAPAEQRIGVGQTWQDVSSGRVAGTTYFNTTGRPIEVKVVSSIASGANGSLTVDGTVRHSVGNNGSGGVTVTLSAIVPSGSSYSCTTKVSWYELR